MLISEIAIIVPVYNTGKYKLSKCIQSILAQTYRHFTLILVDDGSTDDTATVALDASKLDKSIRVHMQSNQGPSEARNTGIDLATGSIALFLDSDDILNEHTFETVVNEFREHPEADLVSFDFDVYGLDGKLASSDKLLQRKFIGGRLLRGGEALENLHGGSLGNFLWMYAYRISYIKKLGIKIPKQFGVLEDAVYMYELFMNNPTVWCSHGEPLYHYFMNPDSITHISRTNKAEEALRAIEAIRSTGRVNERGSVYLVRLLLFAGSLVDGHEKESTAVIKQVENRITELLPKTNLKDLNIKEIIKIILILSGLYTRVKSIKS